MTQRQELQIAIQTVDNDINRTQDQIRGLRLELCEKKEVLTRFKSHLVGR